MNSIYTDYCNKTELKKIKDNLNINVIIRDEDKWDINYVISHIMDTHMDVIIIHDINEMSIVEIGLAAFMNKHILVTCKSVKEYRKLPNLINDIQPGCDLRKENNSFINWYLHTVR